MKSRIIKTTTTYTALSLTAGLSIMLPALLLNSASANSVLAPPDTVRLAGTVRDFALSHPDFGITGSSSMGHAVRNIASTLGVDGRPELTGAGQAVATQWYDKDGNPIQPIDGGPGLAGGHFDVDVYDVPTTKELYHEHEFDDKFDVTYVDIANDSKLLFDSVIGSGYPNDLRMEFNNVHNGGGGTFIIEDVDGVQAGNTADGFTTTFDPGSLTQLRVNFIALDFLRQTSPGTSQDDAVDRDDSFFIRMYDVISNDMVYEIAVYHHFKKAKKVKKAKKAKKKKKKNNNNNGGGGIGGPTQDACGAPINDVAGTFGSFANGAITDTSTFDQWFRDDLGTNMSIGHEIELQRNLDGVYEYVTDSFFPVDGRLMGNGSDAHNNYFTFSLAATFTYNQCTAQFFQFESNDDAWVFIDNKLVIDLGGTATPSQQYVALDRLGLVDGQEYTMNFYYAHRRDVPYSLFDMRTNLVFNSTNNISTGSAVYD